MAEFTVSKDRFDYVDFMTPVYENAMAFAIRVPAENHLTIYLRPFQVKIIIFHAHRSQFTPAESFDSCFFLWRRETHSKRFKDTEPSKNVSVSFSALLVFTSFFLSFFLG